MQLDSEKERQRLAALYAEMPLEQLQQIASESSDLTDIARAALQAEMARRGPFPSDSTALDYPEGASNQSLQNQPAVPDERELVMVRRFRDLPEALLAKGSLDSAGIESFMSDDNMVRLDWFISNLLGGVKLLVRQEDFADATAVLNQPIPENFDVEGVGNFEQPHCPQCGSLDVSFEELNKPIAYGSAGFLHLPIPVHNRGWACHDCGHSWDGPTEEVSATE